MLAKFTQHSDLRATLLGTGEAKPVEHTTNDHYWGDGGDGNGKSRTERIFIKVREAMRHDRKEDNDPAEAGLRATEPG